MAKKLKLHLQRVNNSNPQITEDHLRKINEFASECGDGCYDLDLYKSVKHKSQSQLGAHFGLMIGRAIAEANETGIDTSGFLKEMVKEDLPSGVGLTVNFLKEIFYALCPIYRDDKRITLSKANTEEASKHFEDCCNLLANHHIYIPEPNPNWQNNKLKEKELINGRL